ncbi:imidazole glycerol phosphate synthase subunit HisF [Nicoliella lavandulae]|uniref:Imidazole glycerol phosphate synthase subunit HisF n=1 Tax=Nicoliella lavandulae TaxID=3082954 RepID=A0ABU8SLY8_9LACO
MLAKRIIPCLDVDDGRVKKGVNFLNLKDVGDPVKIAAAYEQQGADELVFLDITATNEQRNPIQTVVKQVSSKVFMPLTVGGGIKSVADMDELLKAGADKVAINTAAIRNPDLITAGSQIFGSQAIVVAIDVKWEANDQKYYVYTNGGQVKTDLDALEWAKQAVQLGAGELLVTSMDQDGTKDGFDIELYRKISNSVNVPVIASGGAGQINDFTELFLNSNVTGALAASVFHFQELTIPEVKGALKEAGVAVRCLNQTLPN